MDTTNLNLNWALEKEHAEKPDLLDREIVWFDIQDFFNYVQKPWTLDSNNLKRRGKEKIEKAKKHFSDGGWMDVSEVRGKLYEIHPQHPLDDRLMIENRHRLLAALELGETHAPFSVPDNLVEELKSAIKFI